MDGITGKGIYDPWFYSLPMEGIRMMTEERLIEIRKQITHPSFRPCDWSERALVEFLGEIDRLKAVNVQMKALAEEEMRHQSRRFDEIIKSWKLEEKSWNEQMAKLKAHNQKLRDALNHTVNGVCIFDWFSFE